MPVNDWNNNNGAGRQAILLEPDGNNGVTLIQLSLQRTPVY
jgi:hypothetical protein